MRRLLPWLALAGVLALAPAVEFAPAAAQVSIVPSRTQAPYTATHRTSVTVNGATTFAVTSGYMELVCTGAETINTITGGVTGMLLILEHTDTECTIADDDAATAANAVDLTGAGTNDVGAAAKVIGLLYNGTSWYQVFESDN